MDNGLVQLTFSKPGGDLVGIKYNGINNLLAIHNHENDRGYWDVVWRTPEKTGLSDRLQGTKFKIVKEDENQVEISFRKSWNVSYDGTSIPINVDKRYIILRGYSGFYKYAVFDRLDGWPAMGIGQIRAVYKLHPDKFTYMAISDDRQRIMPTKEDRLRGQRLDYPEAVILTHPENPQLKGEVDDKYQYSCDNKDNKIHGWISEDPPVGFWMITPSHEFRTDGPFKQELTSHTGPTVLSMFASGHYAGRELAMKFKDGEPWKKVFGPVSIYLNSVSSNEANTSHTLWKNAKEQMQEEVKKWPYNFTQSEDFPHAHQRGSVSGQLLVQDKYMNESLIWGNSAYVGLAAPGDKGSWQRESKGYQFWTQADRQGLFSIKNIRPGNYSLYASVSGFIGDYKYDNIITIQPGSNIKLDILVYKPPRNGPTLWEIGIPDRTAAEFYVPDPYPNLTNTLFNNNPKNKFRQYGLWDRYADLYPKEDLSYTIDFHDYRKDWFFAHVTRKTGDRSYKATTWQVIFELENGPNNGDYTLQIALAWASFSELQVRFNDKGCRPAHFTTGLIGKGKDNAIARHGIHGLYWFYSIKVPSYRLRQGNNTIYLTQSKAKGHFNGIMYDYIRLEGPSL
ncbi:probable rhamnogalacturonate lyase B [Ziziphus jujuba]|uniref:rhamnogalacturonan endolyase n=1 Tax=Ziziphus jujuba TaxID=326968 RepID=A0ABM3ISX5_ZIZJJ|nr:probable rhamnogalacturonate lyase B [Ziziphus jujuba]